MGRVVFFREGRGVIYYISFFLEREDPPSPSPLLAYCVDIDDLDNNNKQNIFTDPTRRYDWIEYEDGRILGRKDQCASKTNALFYATVMRLSLFLNGRLLTLQTRSRWTVGGGGYFTTAPIACANATPQALTPTVTGH